MAMSSARKVISIAGRSSSGVVNKGVAFAPVQFAQRRWADESYETRYHVYLNPDKKIIVTAESAGQALRECGVKRPYKLVRGQNITHQKSGIVRKGRLVKN